jgi:hypothetical protein
MPVLFDQHPDPMSPGLVATTSNPVNCLGNGSGIAVYSETGCAAWNSYVESLFPAALAFDAWKHHCNYGEVHCATAAIRSAPVNPPWWKVKANWE